MTDMERNEADEMAYAHPDVDGIRVGVDNVDDGLEVVLTRDQAMYLMIQLGSALAE